MNECNRGSGNSPDTKRSEEEGEGEEEEEEDDEEEEEEEGEELDFFIPELKPKIYILYSIIYMKVNLLMNTIYIKIYNKQCVAELYYFIPTIYYLFFSSFCINIISFKSNMSNISYYPSFHFHSFFLSIKLYFS